jgi:hypothetical protein
VPRDWPEDDDYGVPQPQSGTDVLRHALPGGQTPALHEPGPPGDPHCDVGSTQPQTIAPLWMSRNA